MNAYKSSHYERIFFINNNKKTAPIYIGADRLIKEIY